MLMLLLVLPALPAEAGERLEITAGPVQSGTGGISGSFRLQASARGGDSLGTGGACLVYSARRRGGDACRKDAECKPDAVFAGGSGYCLRSDPSRAGRCWIRPAETPRAPACRRSPVAPLPIGEVIGFPVDPAGQALPLASPRPGWWRVLVCLNQAPGACAVPDGPNRHTGYGPPRRIR